MPAPVERPAPPIPTAEESPTVGLDVAGPSLGIRLTKSYELAKTGQLVPRVPVIKVGAKPIVHEPSVAQWLKSRETVRTAE